MSEGKTVKLEEVPKVKTRIFKSREPFEVPVPEAVSKQVEDCPVSVTITPMEYVEAEARKRLKRALSVATRRSNREAGVSEDEVTEYHSEYYAILEGFSEDSKEAEAEKAISEFRKKWADLVAKLETKDMTLVYDAQDNLRQNAVEVVAKNCVSINWEDRKVEIGIGENDFIHPDFFQWILAKIEENSYLTEGEVLGFL